MDLDRHRAHFILEQHSYLPKITLTRLLPTGAIFMNPLLISGNKVALPSNYHTLQYNTIQYNLIYTSTSNERASE